ncbi:hypothetical protein LINPERHAP2_LOCUS19950 [Linum perenne]
MTVFPQFSVQHLVKMKSDHRPLLLVMNERVSNPLPRSFWFLAGWLAHDDFPVLLREKWQRGVDLPFQLANISPSLQKWNKEVFGNILTRKKELMDDLLRIENVADYRSDNIITGQELDLRRKLEEVLWQEELLWIQKLRANWIINGDRNTRYFHVTTMMRRARNLISKLKNDAGCWVSDLEELARLAILLFADIFKDNGASQSLRNISSAVISDPEALPWLGRCQQKRLWVRFGIWVA